MFGCLRACAPQPAQLPARTLRAFFPAPREPDPVETKKFSAFAKPKP
jgi:hypothetical protein